MIDTDAVYRSGCGRRRRSALQRMLVTHSGAHRAERSVWRERYDPLRRGTAPWRQMASVAGLRHILRRGAAPWRQMASGAGWRRILRRGVAACGND